MGILPLKKMANRLACGLLLFAINVSSLQADPFAQGLRAQENGQFAAAIEAYREAAQADDTSAMINLGNLLRTGLGTEVDHVQAVYWYHRAASAGDPLGQVNLANMYLSGWGLEASSTEAVRWFRRAARQGNATAQHNLGLLLSQVGHPLHDPSEAFFWFELASRGGILTAEHATTQLAQILTKEQLHDVRIRANRFQAAPESRQDAWSADSSRGLQMFGDGAIAAAFAAFAEAATLGETGAQYELAQLYQNGIGVQRDPIMAQHWLQTAARNGHRLANMQIRTNEDLAPRTTMSTAEPTATEFSSAGVSPGTSRITGADETRFIQASDSEPTSAATPASIESGRPGTHREPGLGTSVENRVKSLLREWSEAWSEQDFARYISLYSNQFVPAGGLSRAAWHAQRQSRLRRPEWITVQLEDPGIEPLGDRRWRVQFTQNYHSNLYQSASLKELVLGLEDGILRIESERVLR